MHSDLCSLISAININDHSTSNVASGHVILSMLNVDFHSRVTLITQLAVVHLKDNLNTDRLPCWHDTNRQIYVFAHKQINLCHCWHPRTSTAATTNFTFSQSLMNFVTTLFELIKCLLLLRSCLVDAGWERDSSKTASGSNSSARRKLSRIFMVVLTRLKYFLLHRKSHTKKWIYGILKSLSNKINFTYFRRQ